MNTSTKSDLLKLGDAICSPTRLAVLLHMLVAPCGIKEAAAAADVREISVRRHLDKLLATGVVFAQQGKRRKKFYHVDREELARLAFVVVDLAQPRV